MGLWRPSTLSAVKFMENDGEILSGWSHIPQLFADADEKLLSLEEMQFKLPRGIPPTTRATSTSFTYTLVRESTSLFA